MTQLEALAYARYLRESARGTQVILSHDQSVILALLEIIEVDKEQHENR